MTPGRDEQQSINDPHRRGGRTVIGGRFVVDRAIETGGQGVVLRAEDRQSAPAQAKVVALKLVDGVDEESRRRFRREYRLLQENQHPHVVPVLLFGEEPDGTLWYAMPLARQSLEARLDGGSLTPDEALAVLRQICDGVAHLHHVGVVHRDLKPGNVLEVEVGYWVVSDFGYARSSRGTTTRLTESGASFGTPWYCAPEQWADAHAATERSDVYSLGRLCQEALLGYESDLNELEHQAARSVLRRATAVDPDARQASVRTFIAQLESALAAPGHEWKPAEPWQERRERVLVAIRNAPLHPSTLDEIATLMHEAVSDRNLLEQFESVLVAVDIDQIVYFWEQDRSALRGFLSTYAAYVPTVDNYDFGFTDHVADFWRRCVRATDDPRIRAQALLVLGELGPRHNRWHVRDVFTTLLHEVRTADEATYADESLRTLEPRELDWSLEGLDARTLHPMLQNAIGSRRTEE